MSPKKSHLEHRQEELSLYIQDMLDRAKDVELCSKNNYLDLHSRILELEASVKRIVICSHQIKALQSANDGSLGLDFES